MIASFEIFPDISGAEMGTRKPTTVDGLCGFGL